MAESTPYQLQTRSVDKIWRRKRKGRMCIQGNDPVGTRTPNMQIWAPTLEDFYWIQRFPCRKHRCSPSLSVWSISMIREFGEKDGDIENRFDDVAGEANRARVRQPWPLLKLPDGVQCEQDIGIQDEGSDYCLNLTRGISKHQRMESPHCSEADHNQIADTSSDAQNGIGMEVETLESAATGEAESIKRLHEHLAAKNARETDHDTGGTEYMAKTLDGTSLPPKLEEFLPKEFFPDVLVVRDPDNCAIGDQGRFPFHSPSDVGRVYRYKRVLPENEGEYGSESSPRIACLELSAGRLHGVGSHSSVYRVSLLLPPPLTANSRSKDGRVTVIAKTAYSYSEDRRLLENEGRIFNTLSSDKYRYMQQEWCGLNKMDGILDPVPVSAVVPKFYGYYVPEQGASDKNLSPILLMEDCGSPVRPWQLSFACRDEILSLFLHLHNAGFVHNSPHDRNILVQPGPLTRPPIQRSMKTPSFRLIDFGRTERRENLRARYDIEEGDGKFDRRCDREKITVRSGFGLLSG